MNFWNDKQLALKLKNNEVTSRDQFDYFMLFSKIPQILSLFLSKNIVEFVLYGTFCCYMLFGTIKVYMTNARGDNKDFLVRYFTLAIVASIRTFVMTLLLIILHFPIIISLIMTDMNEMKGGEILLIFFFIYINILFAYFFRRLNSAMKIAYLQN